MYIMCTVDAAPRFDSPGKPGHLHRHKHHKDVTPEKGEGGEAVKTPVLVKDPIIVDVMTDQPPSRRMDFSSDRPQIAPLNVHHTYMRDEPNSTQEVTDEADDGNTVGMSRRRRFRSLTYVVQRAAGYERLTSGIRMEGVFPPHLASPQMVYVWTNGSTRLHVGTYTLRVQV